MSISNIYLTLKKVAKQNGYHLYFSKVSNTFYVSKGNNVIYSCHKLMDIFLFFAKKGFKVLHKGNQQ